MNAPKTRKTKKEAVSQADNTLLDQERYLVCEGSVHLTGIQALVRLPLDNLRLLKKIFPSKRFAYFISGYEGSPLGGLDINLRKIYPILKEWNIIHVPGGNEEAAANMMWGSQLHRLFGPSKVDGIIGAWYGKGPGVRRIADVQDHLQMAGLDKLCAAYFMSGDDHASKSSTTPHQTDVVHFANHVPTAYPGSIREILDIGKKITLASMISGLSINLKVETHICDGSQEFVLDPEEDRELAKKFHQFLKEHQDYSRLFSPILLRPKVLENEKELLYSKIPMIQEISREFGFDTWKNRNLKSDFGIVATGKSYYDLLGALRQLNISENEVEIYKPMITWPPDMVSFREFTQGKREIIVIEEKRAFYENHIKHEMFNDAHRPVIVGKKDERGEVLFRQNNNLDTDILSEVLGKRLAAKELFKDRGIDRILKKKKQLIEISLPINIKRPPGYCSGCQHRTALEIAGHHKLEGTVDSIIVENKDMDGNPVSMEITPKHLLGIGIGCSTMSIIDTLASNRAVVVGPMESEGLLWMGASAFSYRMHADQGCGDGTYFHSARLNISFIRDAIQHLKRHYDIEDTNQTLLYVDNSVVAMTGGQRPVGQDDPETAIANIQKEGIQHIALVAEYPEEFIHLKKKYGIEVFPKSETLQVKEEYSKKPGLSVIWYVQKCAIEKSRERRRDVELAPKTRVHVNPEVCEDCGDCGVEAKCASVWKMDTEFGPKVKIHQFSCIQDFACARGECPSYVRVYTQTGQPLLRPDLSKIHIGDDELEDPKRNIDPNKVYEIFSIGIGGWGLMTTYEILARAATKEGKHVVKEDDTGLAQKGGEVNSNLKISHQSTSLNEGFDIEAGEADIYFCSDLIGAVNPANLVTTSRKKTVAIVNTQKIPTMPMIVGKETYPEEQQLIDIINEHTIKEKNIFINATDIVERLFKDFKPTNLFMAGLAFQSIKDFPIEHASSIEEGIRANGVDVEKNIQAFRYGRLYAINPTKVLNLAYPKPLSDAERIDGYRQDLGVRNKKLFNSLLEIIPFDPPYQTKFAREIYELIKFQNGSYAEEFVRCVERVYKLERSDFPRRAFQLTKAVADNLFKLMAYKDEYRVADLLTRPEEIKRITSQYEAGEIKKLRFLLRPPLLEHIPWIKNLKYVKDKFEKDEKWEFPGWALHFLKNFKFLRGTFFNVLAWGNQTRKLEIEAIPQYQARIEQLLGSLNEGNYNLACEAASYPSLATGYEKLKNKHVELAETFWNRKHAKFTSGNGKARGRKIPSSSFLESPNPF
ncbi:MAG: 2-oxoacid:acceptor oxidoreductase family protein [Nitrospinae bacterium]|nr:2-oxoacid:acceptor oxidoreductase family protein [Nitrospinota bacterium]